MILIERIECRGGLAGSEPCKYYNLTCRNEDHETAVTLHPIHWAFTEGVASTHLTRVTNSINRDKARCDANGGFFGGTGVVHAKIVDTDTFQPMLTDEEQAAYRIGGMAAVRVLRKGLLPPKPRKPRAKRCPVP